MLAVAGFALATAFWPGWIGAATTPRWAVAAIIASSAIMLRARPTAAHWWGLAFIAWCAFTTVWSEARLDSMAANARLLLTALLFLVGASLADLRWFYRGAALGLGVSSALAIMEAYGVHIAPGKNVGAGLFMNSFYFAEAAALIGIALVAARDMWWSIPLLPVLFLVHGRGAILAFSTVAVAALGRRHALIAVGGLLAVAPLGLLAFYDTVLSTNSIWLRAYLWYDAFAAITPFGHGVGSFSYIFPVYSSRTDTATVFADHPHNMAIELVFECGWPALFLAAAFVGTLLLKGRRSPEKFVLIVFLMDGLYAFPDQMPFTLAVAALAAGNLSRSLPVIRLAPVFGGAPLLDGPQPQHWQFAQGDVGIGPAVGGHAGIDGADVSVDCPVSDGSSQACL